MRVFTRVLLGCVGRLPYLRALPHLSEVSKSDTGGFSSLIYYGCRSITRLPSTLNLLVVICISTYIRVAFKFKLCDV